MGSPMEYQVRRGTIDSGRIYEISITALLSLKCCLTNLEDFWIATNVDQCGYFDDIVLFTKEKNEESAAYLMQLKHQDRPHTITANELFKAKKGFSFSACLDDCLELSNKISRQDRTESSILDNLRNIQKIAYILFTNRNAAKTDFELAPSYSNLINIDGAVYQLKLEKLHNIIPQNDPRREFIDKIFFYVKQPHVSEVGNKIKELLKKSIGSIKKPDKEFDEVVSKFISFIKCWTRGLLNGHYVLTKTDVLKKLTELLLEPFMIISDKQITIKKIIFAEEEKYKFWNEIIDNRDLIIVDESDEIVNDFINGFVNAYVAEHKDMVKKSISNFFSEDTYKFQWKTRKIPLVIQVCSKRDVEEVNQILKMSKGLFRIIILNKSETTIEDFEDLNTVYTLADLSPEQQRKLFKYPIRLQGRHLSGIENLELNTEYFHKLNVRDIIYILCNEFNIGSEFEALPDEFVDISLKRVWLRPEVLKIGTDDVFIVRCESRKNFKTCVETTMLDINDSEITEWKCMRKNSNFGCKKIVLYETQNVLEEIEGSLKKTKKVSIHFLILRANLFEWQKSWGTISNIKEFRILENFEDRLQINKQAVGNFSTKMKLMIISSNPGMGKSVFVNYFARHVPTKLWVVKISLSQYILDKSLDLETFFHSVLNEECKSNSHLTNKIFTSFYRSKKVVVLLDGFDETSLAYLNNVKQLVKSLIEFGCFVLVTTRKVLQNELELLLDTFFLDLNLFTRTDQECFLKKYFSKLSPSEYKADTTTTEFVKHLLDASKSNLNDDSNKFTGVPLHLLMLAETFIEDFRIFIKKGRFISKHFDLLYLYERFIQKKIKIACEKYGVVSEDIIHLYDTSKEFYALRLLFSQYDLEELRIGMKLESAILLFPHLLQLIQKDGIVIEEDMNINFIHRNFAEYYVAKWLAKNIRDENKIAKPLLKVTFECNFKLARNVFDRILAKECPLHLAVMNVQTDEIANLINNGKHTDDLDYGGRSFLHLIASWGFYHPKEYKSHELPYIEDMSNKDEVFQMLHLVEDEKLICVKDKVLDYTPIDYAIISRSLHIANELCRKMGSSQIYVNTENLNGSSLLDYCQEMKYLSLINVINNTVKRNTNVDEIDTYLE